MVAVMTKPWSSLAIVLALSACAVPPSATPDPALASRVQSLMGDDVCSARVAGALAAYRLTADGIAGIDLSPVPPGYSSQYDLGQRQAWVRQPGQPGAIVVQYDRRGCRVATVYARDGAVLPAV